MKVYAGLGIFWYSFMRSIFTESSESLKIMWAIFFDTLHVFFVPGKFGFSYVALGLALCYTYAQLTKENKDKYYNSLAICMAWTGTVQLWLEGLACDDFMVNYGGHLVYDVSIPIAFLIFFYYARSLERSEKSIKVE